MDLSILIIFLFFITFIVGIKLYVRQKNTKTLKMNKWMNMSNNQRNLFDSKEKFKVIQRKKLLLKETRKEYQAFLKKKNK